MREEMRAEKREKRQRKSVIYYYIAIVITAFFGTGLSLYLKGGVPFVKEGAPIFMKIAGIVVVLLLTILLYCKAQKRKWKIVGVISIVLLAAVFSWFASGISKEAALKPHTLDTPETEFSRYDIQDGHFTVKEPNPNIIKEINEDVLKNVVIHFSKPIEQNIAIKVMYTNRKDEDFSKEKKVNFKAQKGATQAVVPVEQRDVSRVKIVIGKKIGAQFDFGSIELNGNYQERLKEKERDFLVYYSMFIALPCCFFLFASLKGRQKLESNIIIKILAFPFALCVPLGIFLALLVKYLVEWVKVTCGDVTFSTILLQLTSPIKGTDSGIIHSIIQTAVLPPVILTVMVVLCYIFFKRELYTLKIFSQKKIPRWSKIIIELCVAVILLHTIHVQGSEIGMWEYLRNSREVSTFYEDYYVDPDNTTVTFPDKKNNLIYIFMESMESSYTDKAEGGTMDVNYIPNLTKLAKENVQFSDKADKKMGGPVCLEGTAYTAGGLVAQTSAINLKVKNAGTVSDTFLPNLTALGDYLDKEGYQQVFLCGSDGDFAGRDAYFKTHKNYKIEDYNAAIKEGDIPKDYKVYWGHEDKILYERAKKQLKKLSSENKPFNLTMLTVDTHFPTGFLCSLCDNKYNTTYGNAVACADKQVYDFINWIKQQDFYENTTIVIVGDHTSMVDTGSQFWKPLSGNYIRTVYNTIINPQCAYKEAATQNRRFTTMDMFPTTMAALGAKIDGERLGLGTNLFSGKETLREKMGGNYINKELKKNDKKYNKFY